jgi:hypothetical protein
MEESGMTKEKKLTWQRWRCWWLAVASFSWLPMVSNGGSSFCLYCFSISSYVSDGD